MTNKTILRKDYKVPNFQIDNVELYFNLHEEETLVMSQLKMQRNLEGERAAALVLNGEALELVSLQLDGKALDPSAYEVGPETLTIHQPPQSFTLNIEVRIHPETNKALSGLYKTSGNFCTQCEAHGFRRITYFLDRPDVMTRFVTVIEADKSTYPVLLSNGNPIERGELPNNRHFVKWQDPFKKPCYLFALVAGDLAHVEDYFTAASGRRITLQIFVEKGKETRCDHAMHALKCAMKWDEEKFGREYDLDIFMIVAVSDFNMGAMENKGLNIFNDKYILANPQTATDADYEGIYIVVGHEYFHNWTGNRITCRDWFQLTLKEGLTVYRDHEFSSDMTSRAVKRISDVNVLRGMQFLEDAGPTAHPIRPEAYQAVDNFYTATVYEKGSEVIRMLHTLVGDAGFRKGMDLYFERFDGQAVTCDDFVQAIADANEFDPTQFALWYSQAGTPTLTLESAYDASTHVLTLQFTQSLRATPSTPDPKPMQIPVQLGLLDSAGSEMPLILANEGELKSDILQITQAEQRVVLSGVYEKPALSLLRNFSAPVNLQYDYNADELMFLLGHDSDPVARWNAGQMLVAQTVRQLISMPRAKWCLSDAFVTAYAKLLSEKNTDPAFIALALTLPTEKQLLGCCEPINPDAIHEARNFVRWQLVFALRDSFMDVYQSHQRRGAYQYTAESAGSRSLKNVCLQYLMRLDDCDIQTLCYEQFSSANNMTDTIAALSALSNADCPERIQALAEFAERWQAEHLVMDKWFSIQALGELPDTLEHVKQLTEHHLFTLDNPNKVYSLIRCFGSGNHVHFHRADGASYVFMADQIIQINGFNPQVASRVVEPFMRWRQYDETRQGLMKAQLERIAGTEGLSKDVGELVEKALG